MGFKRCYYSQQSNMTLLLSRDVLKNVPVLSDVSAANTGGHTCFPIIFAWRLFFPKAASQSTSLLHGHDNKDVFLFLPLLGNLALEQQRRLGNQ